VGVALGAAFLGENLQPSILLGASIVAAGMALASGAGNGRLVGRSAGGGFLSSARAASGPAVSAAA
jgi:drug/metabolite transporter (DMT)-like permease